MRTGPEYDQPLVDGTTVHIRPVRPEDRPAVQEMFTHLSPETVRRRFFGSVPLDEALAERHVVVIPGRSDGVVATVGAHDDAQIVGIARYERVEDEPPTAEFGVLVEDAYQHRGIGTALLRHLAEIAREQGIEHLIADVLADNHSMLRVLRDLGLTYSSAISAGVVTSDFDLEPGAEYLAAIAHAEKVAAQAAMRRFLSPESIAVVGASRSKTSIGGLVLANLFEGDFTGVVYPVNAKTDVVQGVQAYPSLSDSPKVPDLVFVCVPAPAVQAVVDEAGRLGVKAICVISAGFAETGDEGRQRQIQLMEVARGYGMRVIGPNCMGLANGTADIRLNGTFSRIFPKPGRLSFLSQSGALGLSVLAHLKDLGLGLTTFVSVGNKADISGNDLLLYWEDDPHTDVILLYLESFGNPRRFSRIARRVSRTKPIVAVKAGRTKAGQRAASSHTAALSAGDTAVAALFRQTGIIRTDTLDELFAVATLLATQPPPNGRRVAIVTNGGGPGILAADACEAYALEVPATSPEVRAKLGAFLPAEAGLSNPIDMIASSTAEQYGQTVRILAESGEFDAVLAIFIPPIVTREEDVARELVAARHDMPTDMPLISVFMGSRGVPEALTAAAIPSFPFPEEACKALHRVVEWVEWQRRPEGSLLRPVDVDRKAAQAVVDEALEGAGEQGAWLSTAAAQSLLAAYGVPLARSVIVDSPEAAAKAQADIGMPVAVKVAAHIHKVDVGGVELGITSPDAAAAAVRRIDSALEAAGMSDVGGKYVVQQMVSDGIEMAVGVTHDPAFGPLLMVGLGGSLLELVRDVAVRVTPVTDVDVDDMLASLRCRELLDGYRGSAPVDVDSLKQLLYRINALVEDVPEVAELDLNPVFVGPCGSVSVDVRVRVAPAQAGPPLVAGG